jgi:hypothetical protein
MNELEKRAKVFTDMAKKTNGRKMTRKPDVYYVLERSNQAQQKRSGRGRMSFSRR